MVFRSGSSSKSSFGAAAVVSLGGLNNTQIQRRPTGLGEVDRVLGGGLAQGGVVLLTGEPGIGKSTLLLGLAAQCQGAALYVSGEESAEQVSARLKRLGTPASNLSFTAESKIESIVPTVQELKPVLVVIDSLQTMTSAEADSAIGSPNQVRAVLSELVSLAKSTGAAIVVIGHVTKEGVAAGPKTVEHLVDVVLSLEGSPQQELRFLRANKNRFGSTDEVGVFQMKEGGLLEVANPSALFLAERHQGAGSCITALVEGSRSLLVEVQALVTRSRFSQPKRATTGFDFNRLQMLLAVLSERAGVRLSWSDVYVNLAGGFRSKEPSLDLAVCVAVASASLKRALPNDLVVFGEVGLGGEIRPVAGVERRLQEAARLGFKQALTAALPKETKVPAGFAAAEFKHLSEAVEWVR